MRKDRVERFFEYFRNEATLVREIQGREYKVHQKILYASLIDAMAGLVYPTENNRSRFVRTVSTFGDWKAGDKVSTPHLVRLLSLTAAHEFDEVRKLAIDRLEEWSDGDLIGLDEDPDYVDLEKRWPKANVSRVKVEGVTLESVTHIQLLYTFRNALVHEFRPLGTDFEMPEDEGPYYMSLSDAASEFRGFHWDLIYPTVFFSQLTERIFHNVEKYVSDRGIDPIEALKRGRYWLRKLN